MLNPFYQKHGAFLEIINDIFQGHVILSVHLTFSLSKTGALVDSRCDFLLMETIRLSANRELVHRSFTSLRTKICRPDLF